MTLLPQWLLRDRQLMQALAIFSEPIVRITDKLVSCHILNNEVFDTVLLQLLQHVRCMHM
jgi:hypothetical protein